MGAFASAPEILFVTALGLMKTGAQALILVSRLNDAILLTRELVKQRWSPMAILSMGPGWYEDQYLKTLGKLGDARSPSMRRRSPSRWRRGHLAPARFGDHAEAAEDLAGHRRLVVHDRDPLDLLLEGLVGDRAFDRFDGDGHVVGDRRRQVFGGSSADLKVRPLP